MTPSPGSRGLSARLIGQLTLLTVCAIWGGNFIAMHLMLERTGPLDVIFLRTAIAAAGFILLLLALRRPVPAFTRAEWTRLGLMGVLGVAVFNVATATGQSHLPASISSLLVGSSPIFTAIFGAATGVERVGKRTIAAIALATAGLAVLVTWGRGSGVELNRTTLFAAGMLLVAPAAWAAYTVLNKPLLARHPPLEIAAIGMIVGAAILSPLGVFSPGRLGRIAGLDAVGWGSVLFSAVFSLIVAFILFARALRTLTPSEVAMSTYLTPLFAIFFAWLLLGERPTPGLVAGGALIVAGIALVTTQGVAQPPEEG
ncbi:MAG: DMT family transporter [Chloroflexota bacterium]